MLFPRSWKPDFFFFFLNLKIRVDHGTEDYDIYRSWQKASKQVRNTRGIKLFQHYFENSTCMALYNLTYLWHIKHDMIWRAVSISDNQINAGDQKLRAKGWTESIYFFFLRLCWMKTEWATINIITQISHIPGGDKFRSSSILLIQILRYPRILAFWSQ